MHTKMHTKLKGRLSGFTLVELLVAMAIIGVILGLAIFGISAAQRNSRETQRKSAAQDINAGVADYYTKYSSYPTYICPVGSSFVLRTTNVVTACNTATENCVTVPTAGSSVASGTTCLGGTVGTAVKMTTGTSTSNTAWCFGPATDGYALGFKGEDPATFDRNNYGTSATLKCLGT